MKLAVIVSGVLRNFEVSMSNWQWPPGCEVDYYMVTWDKTIQSYNPYACPESSLANIEKAKSILPFKEVRVFDYFLLEEALPNCYRMTYLWKEAAKLADALPGYDSFVVVRPDLMMVPLGKLTEEDQKLLDTSNAFIAQADFIGYDYSGDQIFAMGYQHTKFIKLIYDRMVAENFGPHKSIEIHSFLNRFFRSMRDEMGCNVTIWPHHKWFYQILRRPGFAGPLDMYLFKIEKSHIEWFISVQMDVGPTTFGVEWDALHFISSP